jgi:hypothetical protein
MRESPTRRHSGMHALDTPYAIRTLCKQSGEYPETWSSYRRKPRWPARRLLPSPEGAKQCDGHEQRGYNQQDCLVDSIPRRVFVLFAFRHFEPHCGQFRAGDRKT